MVVSLLMPFKYLLYLISVSLSLIFFTKFVPTLTKNSLNSFAISLFTVIFIPFLITESHKGVFFLRLPSKLFKTNQSFFNFTLTHIQFIYVILFSALRNIDVNLFFTTNTTVLGFPFSYLTDFLTDNFVVTSIY